MNLFRIASGVLAAVILVAVVAVAAWPSSMADKARDDGERLGEAVAQLQSAQTSEEVDAALAEVDAAAADTADHAGDEVGDQASDQADALARAADSAVGAVTADDELTADVYSVELEVAVDDLTGQAEDFRTEAPEAQQAFWEGYESGLSGD